MKNKYQQFGKDVWKWVRDHYPDCCSEDAEDIMELAGKHGLAKRVSYDPRKHGDIEADVGDTIWFWGKSS